MNFFVIINHCSVVIWPNSALDGNVCTGFFHCHGRMIPRYVKINNGFPRRGLAL